MASEEVPPGPGRQSSDNITSSDDTRGPDDDESEGAPFRNFPKTPAGVGSDGLMCDADRCMYDRHNDDILYDSGRQANFCANDVSSARPSRKQPDAFVGADKEGTALPPGCLALGVGSGEGGGKIVLGLGLGGSPFSLHQLFPKLVFDRSLLPYGFCLGWVALVALPWVTLG